METLNTIEYFSFDQKLGRRAANTDKVCRIRKNNTIAFSQKVADIVRQKNALGFRIAKNTITGEWYMCFGSEGMRIRQYKQTRDINNAFSFEVRCKELHRFIVSEICGGDETKTILSLSDDLSSVPNVANFKVIKAE